MMMIEGPLPTTEYKSHKIVRAAKVTAMSLLDGGGAKLFLDEEDEHGRAKGLLAAPEWLDKHPVEPGGYIVVYEDSYVSYSPARAFESGYVQVKPLPEGSLRMRLLPREIHGHEVNECNEAILIVADEQNEANGNASHFYRMSWVDAPGAVTRPVDIRFQDGPIKLVGVNGVTQETLLAVLIDRLRCFQSSQWACPENADALAALELARDALHSRTKKRLARGVEGTHTV